jgi:hypothetical protein
VAGGVEMLVFYPAGKVTDQKGRRWVAVPSMLIMGLPLLLMPLSLGAGIAATGSIAFAAAAQLAYWIARAEKRRRTRP